MNFEGLADRIRERLFPPATYIVSAGGVIYEIESAPTEDAARLLALRHRSREGLVTGVEVEWSAPIGDYSDDLERRRLTGELPLAPDPTDRIVLRWLL